MFQFTRMSQLLRPGVFTRRTLPNKLIFAKVKRYLRRSCQSICLQSICLVVTLALVGCGALPPISEEEAGSSNAEQPRLKLPPRSSGSQTNDLSGQSAIDQLLATADKAMRDGRYDQAAAFAERAMRVEPMDPRSYFSLAQIRHSQQQFDQVDLLLNRARALAASDQTLLLAIKNYQQSIGLGRR